MSDEKKAYFSPLPKMSMGNKKRKSINYLQQCKEEGKKIVQHCPSMLSPLFSMAASMADVDIARLPPAAITGSSEKGIQDAPAYIGSYRQMAPYSHQLLYADSHLQLQGEGHGVRLPLHE